MPINHYLPHLKKKNKRHSPIMLLILLKMFVVQGKEIRNLDCHYNKEYGSGDNSDSITSKVNAQSLLLRAKKEKNWKQAAMAYRTIMYLTDKKYLIMYSDSLLVAAKLSGDDNLIGTAYLTKGIIYYDLKEHKKALDNYLLADEYISKTKNQYAIHKIKYSIAHTKYYLGFYHEAIALLKECISYFEEENDLAYLNSLHSIGLCYNKTGKYELCSYYNNKGLEESVALENLEIEPYFNHSEGINQYNKKNYKTAIDKLTQVLPALKEKNDFANETVAYFYIGKSYCALNQTDKALPFLKKVDKAYSDHNYIRPDLRENYELLIDFYKKQNNPTQQLQYVNKLLKIDSVLNLNYRYLSQRIFKEYDTKQLLKTREEIEESLKSSNRLSYIIIITLSGTVLFLAYRHFRNKKLYKRKFEEIMNEKQKKQKINSQSNDSNENELDIGPDLVAMILKNLGKYETNKKYLEKDMTLIRLAALLNTNTKYASKIIYKYRGKRTIEYVSDLKIDHIIELLKNQNKFRYYTNKALAEEVGFGSTQNFTRAFNQRTGISPTYFVEELKKSFPL